LTDARKGDESEACRTEAARADENDEENPLAEYLAMLGVAPSGTADDADRYGPGPADDDASTPASTSAEPAPIRSATTRTKTSALSERALSDETSDDTTRNIPLEASPASSASETSAPRSRKKASGRRRKALSAKRFPAPLRSVRLARSVSELDALAERLAAGLHDKGYATAEFITAEAVRVVRSEIANVAPFYTPGEIWLGRDDAGAQISVKSVRGDRVFWMDPEQIEAGRFDALASVLKAIDTLVLDHMARDARRPRNEKRKTARRLAGLADRTHAMLAEYPGRASRFVKHVDNTARDGRRLTVLCYLNEDWRGEHGGALKVYDRTGPDGASERDGAAASLEVAPAGGALAMFYADEVPHEVLPSHRSRHSFTVWYYDRQESEEASRRGRGEDAESPSAVARAAHRPTVDDVSADLDDLAASSFVKTMMTENLSPERAFEAAATLTGPALATAAAVFGAPGADALLATLKRITREELRELRSEMVNMGMQA
jgi:hypoxia-inducible factor (prolyl hydroxylase)